MVKIAIVTYSLYGHIDRLAIELKHSITEAGGTADIYKVQETLSPEDLEKVHASPANNFPVIEKEQFLEYDAYLFGIPTRYGNCPAQWTNFWDRTGDFWVKGALEGKAAGFFISTGSYGGGQEVTARVCSNYLVHHGMIFIPLGYSGAFAELGNVNEVHGGSPWGAGTLSGLDGKRTPSSLELKIANIQGKKFYNIVNKIYPSSSNATNKKPTATPTKTKAATESKKTATTASNVKKSDPKKNDLCCIIT